MKLALFRFLDNIFNDLLFSQMLLQLIFKVRKSNTGKNLQPRHNSVQGDLKNLKKYGQVTAHLKFKFRPNGPLKEA